MIEKKAYIASNLNNAIVIEEEGFYLISGTHDAEKKLIDSHIFSQFIAVNPEIKPFNFTEQENLQAEIRNEYERHEALSMALEVMDNYLSLDYRSQIAGELDNLLAKNQPLFAFIENRLLGTPLPQRFDAITAFSLTSNTSANLLYQDLGKKSKIFEQFYTVFYLTFPFKKGKQSEIDALLTDNGLYSAFTKALYNGQKENFVHAFEKTITALLTSGSFASDASFSQNELMETLIKKLEVGYGITFHENIAQLVNIDLNDPTHSKEFPNVIIGQFEESFYRKMQAAFTVIIMPKLPYSGLNILFNEKSLLFSYPESDLYSELKPYSTFWNTKFRIKEKVDKYLKARVISYEDMLLMNEYKAADLVIDFDVLEDETNMLQIFREMLSESSDLAMLSNKKATLTKRVRKVNRFFHGSDMQQNHYFPFLQSPIDYQSKGKNILMDRYVVSFDEKQSKRPRIVKNLLSKVAHAIEISVSKTYQADLRNMHWATANKNNVVILRGLIDQHNQKIAEKDNQLIIEKFIGHLLKKGVHISFE